MTLVIPEGIETIGNLNVRIIPAIAAVATGITLAEWNAGTDIQLSIRSFPVNGEQAVFEDIRLGTVDILEGLGRNRISIDPVQVVYDPQEPDNTTTYKAHSLLMAGGLIYIGERLGLPQTDAAAADQIVSFLHQVKVGQPNEVPVDPTADGEKFMRSFKLAFQRRWIDVPLIAGS